VVVIARTEEADDEPGTTDPGLRLQVDASGTPLQLNDTAFGKAPPTAATVTVYWAVSPELMVTEAGEAASEKSAPVPLRGTMLVCEGWLV